MSKTLLRELLLTSGIQTVELPDSTETDVPAVLVYVGKQKVEDPTRIEIEEIVPISTPTVVNPSSLINQNKTINVETNYQDLMALQVCLDNYDPETILDSLNHEAFVEFTSPAATASDIFPLLIEIQEQQFIFPVGTTLKELQDTLMSFGILVGTVSAGVAT